MSERIAATRQPCSGSSSARSLATLFAPTVAAATHTPFTPLFIRMAPAQVTFHTAEICASRVINWLTAASMA